MTDLLVVSGMVLLAGFGAAYLKRQRSVLLAENEKLRDQLSGTEQRMEIAKLQDKLNADQKSGMPAEIAYENFRASHSDLLTSDSKVARGGKAGR